MESLAQLTLICLSVELTEVADRDGDCKTHSKLVQTGEWSERFVGSSSNTEELEKRGNRWWGEYVIDGAEGVKCFTTVCVTL